MAREATLDTFLIGAAGVGAAAVIGTQAFEYYRSRKLLTEARIICRECGESVPIDEVLDPSETCACVTSDVRTG